MQITGYRDGLYTRRPMHIFTCVFIIISLFVALEHKKGISCRHVNRARAGLLRPLSAAAVAVPGTVGRCLSIYLCWSAQPPPRPEEMTDCLFTQPASQPAQTVNQTDGRTGRHARILFETAVLGTWLK